MEKLNDLSRLCLHTITTKPWSIEQATENYAAAGVRGISVWRDAYENHNTASLGDSIRRTGLNIVATVRGGFFPALRHKDRIKAIDENLLFIEESAELGSPLIVLVCGASVDQPLSVSRDQIKAGIEAILPAAIDAKIKLAIEPLHPMYADIRSAINTLRQANELAEHFNSPNLGVAVDVYHLWWDPDLQSEIRRCGSNNHLFAFHVCDWLTPTIDMLNDRGLMGEGCIPVREIRHWMEAAGFSGYIEVEIFSNRHWAEDQNAFLKKIISAYLEHV